MGDADSCVTSSNFPQNYGNNEYCEIWLDQRRYFQMQHFVTDPDDYLTVDVPYSGNVSFAGFHEGRITWSSNGAGTDEGWKICPFVAHNPLLDIVTGSGCVHESNAADSCVTSLGFPQNYGRNEYCKIQIAAEASAVSTSFNTESYYDVLTGNGQDFSGSHASAYIHEGTIEWRSNWWGESSGWRICPHQRRDLGVILGEGCQFETPDGTSCITSRNYPLNYSNADACTMVMRAGTKIRTDSFSTHPEDVLSINGQNYAGSNLTIEEEVNSDGTIVWSSDASNSHQGWKICLVPVAPRSLKIEGSGCQYEDTGVDSCITSRNWPQNWKP